MLITNTTILKADGSTLLNKNIGIKGDTISCINSSKQGLPQGNWRFQIDGTDKIVMPGMINSHTHVPMSLLRGYGEDMELHHWLNDRIFPFENLMTANDVYWGSLLGIAEMLSCGVTSFTDMYSFCEKIIQAVTESGIKANISRGTTAIGTDKKYNEMKEYKENEYLLSNYQGVENGRILIDVAPHAEYTTRPDVLHDMAMQAEKHNARMHIHLSETKKEHLECIGRYGQTPTGLLQETGVLSQPLTAAHCVWLTDIDMEILSQYNVTVAHCPQSNCKLAGGIAQIEKIMNYNIPVALGTDSVASNNNLNLIEEARLCAMLGKVTALDAKVMPVSKLIYMLTKAGANSQGRASTGDIKVGNKADLTIIDNSSVSMVPTNNISTNIIYSADSSQVLMTIVDGEILYDNGDFPMLDIEKIKYNVNKSVKRILKDLSQK